MSEIDQHIARILVCVDFSKEARDVVHYAAALAQFFESKITLLHVVTPLPYPGYTADGSSSGCLATAAARQELERTAAEAIPFPNRNEAHVLIGIPHKVIVAQARATMADLIVIGAYSRPSIERILLGRTAEHVVRHAPCSVLVIRGENRLGEREDPVC